MPLRREGVREHRKRLPSSMTLHYASTMTVSLLLGFDDVGHLQREMEILGVKVPGAGEELSREIIAYVQKLREIDLFKNPGVAETLDWASALIELDKLALDPQTVSDTIGVLLKYQDDIARIQSSEGQQMLDEVKAGLRAAE